MRLTDHDASFLYSESASGPMHATSIVVLEGTMTAAAAREHVASKLPRLTRFRQKLAFVPMNVGHPKWVDDDAFEIDNHVIGHTLPEGSTLDDAYARALEIAEPVLPRNRPLWAIHVIEGVPDRTVLVVLQHHAMVDGASAVEVSLVLFDLQQDPEPEPAAAPWTPAPAPSPGELATEALRETAEGIVEGIGGGLRAFTGERGEMIRRAAESMTRFVTEPVVTAPWNASMVGPKRAFTYRKLPFAEFRAVRRAFGGTVNDVVLTIVSEAAARYLADHGETVQGRHLRIMCPVNVRREDEQGALGNRVSGIFPIVDAEPKDVTDRLREVKWETEQIKQNREAQAMQLMMESMPSVPPVAMAQTLLVGTPFDPSALAARFPMPVPPTRGPRFPMAGFNFTCTNVPGVQTQQYFAGLPILDQMGLLMLSGNLGFGIAVVSYNQNLYFNFVCDPRLMPDIDVMAEGVTNAFGELLTAAEKAQLGNENVD